MDTAKKMLRKLIEEIPEKDAAEVVDFIGYLKARSDRELFKDLEKISDSSQEFWNNDIDDEVWNNV